MLKTQKFTYLSSSLTGSAVPAIEGLQVSEEENYGLDSHNTLWIVAWILFYI